MSSQNVDLLDLWRKSRERYQTAGIALATTVIGISVGVGLSVYKSNSSVSILFLFPITFGTLALHFQLLAHFTEHASIAKRIQGSGKENAWWGASEEYDKLAMMLASLTMTSFFFALIIALYYEGHHYSPVILFAILSVSYIKIKTIFRKVRNTS